MATPDTESPSKKWKSLFQLSGRRHASSNLHDNTFHEPDDELQDDDLFFTKKSKCEPGSRRPSAPAILVDLKNFLTSAVTRRSSSSYGLCTSTSSKDNIFNIPTGDLEILYEPLNC
uniref:Uncharacterized protein n=1 Tax=Panagrolaimus superbus TaxID=310955 RepID=A0A914Y0X4_9BILA